MKPVDDSPECLDQVKLDSGRESIFKWVMIVVCVLLLPLGFTLSASIANSQTIKPRDNSASNSGQNYVDQAISEFPPKAAPTATYRQVNSKLKGYVYNRQGEIASNLVLTVVNTATGSRGTYNRGGKFEISLPNGRYDFTIRDKTGRINRYSDIVINSDTTIKFSFGDFIEPGTTKETPTPVVTIVTPTPVVTTLSPTPPTTITTPTTITPDTNTTPNSNGGDSEIDNSSDDNTNSVNNETNSLANSNTNESSKDLVSRKTSNDKGFFTRLLEFLTNDPLKVVLTIFGALAVIGLVGLVLPLLPSVPVWIGSALGGLGFAGKTSAVDDDVRCTLYSAPEVREGSDLLVQVFAHLLEQADDLEELATMLDPEAKKQLSKSLAQRIKRDSVLTFKLMIPGIEFEENEQDLIWRGEPDSVEFIVPIPADHGDGNRFGRVFVYQNGAELGKIPFRISIVSKSTPIAIEKVEPGVAGVMTQNETAFVSYASNDKDHVYRFVQLMDVLKYDYHIDVFSIEAGDRWENKLYEFIDTDDVFLLFWSESASQSEWVIKEAKRAEERSKSDPRSLPRIIVYRLDEKVAIPEWLQEFHVDRKWAGMIANIKEQSENAAGVALP